jgi:hypothetical protein
MRWPVVACLLVPLACGAPDIQSKKLQDGSVAYTCQLPMDECVRRVQTECTQQRFRILEGISTTRVRGATPFENVYYTSQLRMVCTDDGAKPLFGDAKRTPPSAASAMACTRGATRECVGVGACKGGQACLPDGSAFGPCECGPAIPPPAPAAGPTGSAPAPAPTPAAPAAPAAPAPATPAPAPAPVAPIATPAL